MSFSVVLITGCFTKYLHSILEGYEGGTICILQWEAEAEPGQIVSTCCSRVSSFNTSHNVPTCSESSALQAGMPFASQTHRNYRGKKSNMKDLASWFSWSCQFSQAAMTLSLIIPILWSPIIDLAFAATNEAATWCFLQQSTSILGQGKHHDGEITKAHINYLKWNIAWILSIQWYIIMKWWTILWLICFAIPQHLTSLPGMWLKSVFPVVSLCRTFYKSYSLLYMHPEVFVPLAKNNCILAAHEVANPTSWLLPDYWIFDVPHLWEAFPFALWDVLVKI